MNKMPLWEVRMLVGGLRYSPHHLRRTMAEVLKSRMDEAHIQYQTNYRKGIFDHRVKPFLLTNYRSWIF